MRMFSTIRSYLKYCGELSSVLWGDIFRTVGDILSTVSTGNVQHPHIFHVKYCG